ncbi:trichohyalin-plectin-homology domain domain-containing protein [Candidatus Babeliales bacterium]|nr:trichohyalin-plectin-homology domain domain-containing protein [Candidatus Babeliales bacterium]
MKRSIVFLLSLGLLVGNAPVHANSHDKNETREQKRLREEARRKQADMEKKAKAEKKKQESARKKQERDAANERKRIEREARKREKKANAKMAKEKDKLNADRKHQMKHEREQADKNHREAYREAQKRMAAQWKEIRHKEVMQEYQDGKYADLYKQPAWPTYATYVKHKHLFNIGGSYRYESDAYDADGNNRDITILPFGQEPVLVKDVLLVSKLAQEGLVTQSNYINAGSNAYLSQLADTPIVFLGESEEWRVNLDLARFIWKRNIAVGMQMPVVYQKHRLHAKLGLNQTQLINTLGANPTTSPDEAFDAHYGQDGKKFITDIFDAKGVSQLGGSAGGLGDITFFTHVYLDNIYVDKLMTGLRLVIPTAGRQAQNQLWGPELGNGGFLELGWFINTVYSYKSYFNPHFFSQISGTLLEARVKRRIPRKLSANNNTGGAATLLTLSNNDALGDVFVFGERVELANGNKIDGRYDSTHRGLADRVADFKLRKGFESSFRVGNIFEKFVVRRAFMDVYYEGYCKWEDDFSDLDQDVWLTDVIEENTQQVAHKVGLELNYQFDCGSRLKAGMEYVFAGTNTPKAFTATLNLNYSF